MELSNIAEPEEKKSNIGEQLVTKYLAYWPLFILLSLLSIAGAYVYLRYATPIYQASAKLIIKDENKGGNEDAQISQLLNLVSMRKNIENEMEVLNSRGLMERVVKELYLYAPVSQVGKVKAGDAYVISPIMIEAQSPDSIEEQEKVIFSYDKNSQTVLLEHKFRYPINQFVETPFGILRFLPNRYHFASVDFNKKPLYFSLENPENTASSILKQKRLVITQNAQSAIIDIKYKDPIPQRAVDIINQLITTYNQLSINEKNTAARNTLEFVNKQLNKVTRELDSIENQVQQFKSGKNAVDIGSQGARFLGNVGENDQKLADIDLRLSILEEIEKYLSTRQNGEFLAPSTLGVNDPTLTTSLSQLQSTELEYEKLKKTVGKNNPALLSLSESITKLRNVISENVQGQKKNLEASRASLTTTNSGYTAKLSAVPEKEKQLLEISREQVTKSNQYQFLLQKKQEAEMSVTSVVASSRVVDKAIVDKEPVSPKKYRIYLLALIGGLAGSVALIIIRDNITSKVKYRSEVEKMTSIPIIGEISFEKTDNPLVIVKGARSFVAEEFRKLRIALSFLGINPTHKKILLTSSISGEGKSFIAANLAVTISLIGKKVVLVDLDLNNPTLSDILNVNYEKGVTEIITGEITPSEVINKIDGHDNLYFISAGELPDNPSELLANGKVKSLLDYLETNFDVIIIDTSPAFLVTDAYVLSGLCDATLYVVRHDYSPKMIINRIDEYTQVNPLKNVAIVFNGVKTRGVFKNTYGYGYHYVYDNKYGKRTKVKKEKKANS